MNSKFLFNNEALATVALGDFIRIQGRVDVATSLLVLPFVLHEPTLGKLNSSSNKRSIEEFISQYPASLVSLNARFYEFLPLSINAITILSEIKLVEISGDQIIFNWNQSYNPSEVGKRAEKIFKANRTLSEIFKLEKTSSLYLKLKIQL